MPKQYFEIKHMIFFFLFEYFKMKNFIYIFINHK